MAAENHKSNPVIVEPAPSSDSGGRLSLLTPSLHQSSSSDSVQSSRPQSRNSSATSQSESSSPVPGSAKAHELGEGLPPTPPKPQTLIPDTPPASASVPSAPVGSSSNRNATAWPSMYRPKLTRRWLEHALGVFTLVASLVGLLFIGVRTYKLAVISTENSTLDGCVGLIQANFTTLEGSSPLCKTVMKKGPLSSPYHLGKRALDDTLALASRWVQGAATQRCGLPYISCQRREASPNYQKMTTPTIVISATFVLGALILLVARQNARSVEVFTSPARDDVQIIRRENSGEKIIAGEAVIERHHSEDHHELGQIHRRIRTALDADSLEKSMVPTPLTMTSSTTLVNECDNSQVSLRNRSSGEHHEGLVELQFNGKTKVFLNIKTGVFFRLRHWKDQQSRDSESDDSGGSLGSAKAAKAKGKAKGKAIKDKWIEELKLATVNWHNKRSHPH